MPELFAPAKINLWLNIFAPDSTGYHPLDSLFCAIDLCDTLHISPAKTAGITLDVTGADVGPQHSNLAYRAAVEFYATCGLEPRISIQLHKRIPAGGGLGGGSSDAAAVLSALNELHAQVVPESDLLAIAARLGSDVPFFLCGSPLAHATGRGELLSALPALPSAPLLIVVPPCAISTADAYRWLDDARGFSTRGVGAARAAGWHDVAANAHNDFEPVLFDRHPLLRELKQALTASGATIALVSGSGSALFAVFDGAAARDHARDRLARQFPEVEVVATRTRD